MATSWKQFKEMVQKAFPKKGETLFLPVAGPPQLAIGGPLWRGRHHQANQMTPLPPAAMKWRKGLRAAFGVALCIAGFALACATPYRETTVIVGAGGCRLGPDVGDRGNDDTQGYVVLFHGLAANKKIMSYLAHGFASENLRVFVPDLPGHGRTPGPFSFERAESCADSLVRELIARGAIDAQRTILAGHSLGGAIAIRVAARVGVAGVVAVSPAPMRAAHG